MALLDDAIAEAIPDDLAADRSDGEHPPLPVNGVHLVGKLSQSLQTKPLPSGDVLGKWNLVVARPKPVQTAGDGGDGHATGVEAAAATPRRQSHDTFECISFDEDLIAQLRDVEQGTWLEVRGALRRRFRGGAEGRQSSYNVEARTVAVRWTPPVTGAAAGDPAEPIENAEPVTTAE